MNRGLIDYIKEIGKTTCGCAYFWTFWNGFLFDILCILREDGDICNWPFSVKLEGEGKIKNKDWWLLIEIDSECAIAKACKRAHVYFVRLPFARDNGDWRRS